MQQTLVFSINRLLNLGFSVFNPNSISQKRDTKKSAKMEKSQRRATSYSGMEENTLVILENFCAHDSSHVHDDRLAFLEAVRFASIVPENGIPPTNKMMEAIFEIMREAKSLELIVSSYELLCELEKHFPRVCLSKVGDKQGSASEPAELVIYEEAWSPFSVGLDVALNDTRATTRGTKEPINAIDFQLLVNSLSEGANETESVEAMLGLLGKMYLFQYLVYILEGDLYPRIHNFNDNSDWISVRDSLLYKLLGLRRINYKDLVKDSLYALCNIFPAHTPKNRDTEISEGISALTDNNSDSALVLSLPEVEKCTHKSLQKLLLMMMELDCLKKEADTKGFTTRADSVRTPVVELIMDDLSYDKDMISPFLQAFDEPTRKLEIISQYIQKYNVKPSTRKRKSDGAQEDGVISRFFKSFLNSTSTKSLVKKVGAEAVQVLLAHVLQVCMSISKEQLLQATSGLIDDGGSSPLANICKNIIFAFSKLRETAEDLQILPIGKEAIFTAVTILSVKS